MERKCSKCFIILSLSNFYKRSDRRNKRYSSECKNCFKSRMGSRHQQNKDTLIAEFGGKCIKCGYNKYARVLAFHHTDPSKKEFGISKKLSSNLNKLRNECMKCIILCPNCHAELHIGLWTIEELVGPLGFEPRQKD